MTNNLEEARQRIKESASVHDYNEKIISLSQAIMLIINELESVSVDEGSGDVPEQQEQNLHTHLGTAYLLITEVMAKIGAGNFSDDLDLARAHINTVMVAESKSPLPISPPAPQQTGVEGERFYAQQAVGDHERWFLMDRVDDGLFATGMSERTAKHNAAILNSLPQSRPACEHEWYVQIPAVTPLEFCHNFCGAYRYGTQVLLRQPEGGA